MSCTLSLALRCAKLPALTWGNALRQRYLSSSAKPLSLSRIRNIGLCAHIDAGKTTTSEQMLYLSGEIKSIGRVDNGDTVMDFLPQERERGITISSAAISFHWKDYLYNLIDTPGHVDFTIEVERSARVLDGVVIIIDAVSGVQSQTRTVWKQTRKQKLPAIAFVNKMDRVGANYDQAIHSINTKLAGCAALPIQIPIVDKDSDRFEGIIDLIAMRAIRWPENTTTTTTTTSSSPIPPIIEHLTPSSSSFKSAQMYRKKMIEEICEHDDTLMTKYLNEEDLSTTDIISSLRRACLSGLLVPALCGSSLKSKGVEMLLDSVAAFLPSPSDRPDCIAVNTANCDKHQRISPVNTKELFALAFKVVHDQERGPLVYVRTYAGQLKAKQLLYNTTRGSKERAGQLLLVSADDLLSVDAIGPGQVGCLVGLRSTRTGDTLACSKHNYVLDGLVVPKSVYSIAIEPEKSTQQTALENALEILQLEDPSLEVEKNEKESGLTIIRGIGELHLEIVCDKLLRQHGLEVLKGRAYVAYRESLRHGGAGGARRVVFDRVVGSRRLFAAIGFELLPVARVSDDPVFAIDKALKETVTNDEYIALHDGLRDALTRGLKGYPISGLRVAVSRMEKDPDTTPGAVRACAAALVQQLLATDEHCILEPFMNVEVELPSSKNLGDVVSDLSVKRRAIIRDVVTRASDVSVVAADCPFSTMLGYATAIRSMTQGEGTFSMEFSEYREVDLRDFNHDVFGK